MIAGFAEKENEFSALTSKIFRVKIRLNLTLIDLRLPCGRDVKQSKVEIM